MSKNSIKTTHEIAKEKIDSQYNIAVDIVNSGIETIKKNRNTSRSKVDNFKMRYEQWRGITSEVLNEVFVSTDYSYKFRNQKSSETKLVSSRWQPDIEYYIRNEIKPKIDYLKILSDDIPMFHEETTVVADNEQNKTMSSDISCLTVAQLLGALKPSQLYTSIVIIISIICGSFYFGYEVNSWKKDNDKYNLTKENIEIKAEITNLNKQLSSTLNKLKKDTKPLKRTDIK